MLIVILCVLVCLLADKITKRIIARVKKRNESKPPTRKLTFIKVVLDAIEKPLHWFFITVGCALGIVFMKEPSWGASIFPMIKLILRCISIWCVMWFGLQLTTTLTGIMMEKAKKTESKIDDMVVPIAGSGMKIAVIVVGALLIAQNLGYSVSSIIAGVGIGGAALALAAKDTLANFFGATVVFFDTPFEVGDWITVNGVEGEVEEIRLRVTLIRTFDNTLVYVPNSVLSSANIENWARRKFRKMDCSFGVLYSTRVEQVQQIVADLREHVKKHPEIFGPSCYIHLNSFGDSSIDIRAVVYTLDKGYVQHLQDKHDFLLEIMKIVEKNGTGFAFPTRTLDMPSEPIRVKVDK